MNRRIPFQPAEGWVTLGLVLVMCLTLALAIDDSRWVLGRPEYLDVLMYAALGGVLVGFIGPKVGWGRWLTYLIGSIFAALILPILSAYVAHPGGSLYDLFHSTASSVVAAYIDLAIRNLSGTTQFIHFIYFFGIVIWASSMFASYAVFGHHRPLNAVIVIGLLLVVNVWSTYYSQMPYLVVFSIASLFLLIRSHVFDEQSEWLRRRIGDPASISQVYLRGGTIFIGLAVISSFVLTQTASSAPLAGAWDGVQDGLIGMSQSISRFLPTGGSTRPVGLTFGSSAAIGQQWTTDNSLALTIQRDPADKETYYWRAATYDLIDPTGLNQSKTSTHTDVPAGSSILAGSGDDANPTVTKKITFTVTPAGFHEDAMVSPLTPVQADQDVRLTTIGQSQSFMMMNRAGGSGPYTVTALVPILGNDNGMLNSNALSVAGTTYPSDIVQTYLPNPGYVLGPKTKALENKIVAMAASGSPYDIAMAVVNELQSGDFDYKTDIRDFKCDNLDRVECFATIKTGFCQYYAATMAVILRDLKIPARPVQGFLPGKREANGTEVILNSNAHAWVEVYFPGYGWIKFDPTPPSVSAAEPLPSGPPRASLPPKASAAAGLASLPARPGGDEFDPDTIVPGGRANRLSPGPFIAIGLLLLVVVAVIAFLAWRRGPRGPVSPDGAYGSVTRLAARFGFGPRPAQTVYEYAGTLGEVLPDVRPELQIVARAKVESVYAREILSDERMASLRAAQRRLRVSLLRLAFRRKERRRR